MPEVEAPGDDLSAAEVQSSELTKGAEKQSSAGVYATVADANTANYFS
jgi:hypothetical protein